MLRINESPRSEVIVMPSTEHPTGVGEPGVPPVARRGECDLCGDGRARAEVANSEAKMVNLTMAIGKSGAGRLPSLEPQLAWISANAS
jgi:hypothetical protein